MRYYIIIIAALLLGCENAESIEGLWEVQSVKAGEESVTPNARWIRFNQDHSQVSGNGFFQHTIGTWSFNPENRHLDIVDSNGLDNSYGPFEVSFIDDKMVWEREEDGFDVKVTLSKADELPQTYGDNLLGLWKLVESSAPNQYFPNNVSELDYIFFRWDRRFVVGRGGERVHGVYHVNGHKPEVDLIPYSDDLKRIFWAIEYGEGTIKLTELNSDSATVLEFKKIRQFPK